MIDEEQVLTVTPPPGARFKGYDDFVVQDLQLAPRVIRYRRQRWRTADESRRNFLALLRADHGDHVVNAAALVYMRAHHLAGPVINRLEGAPAGCFADAAAWRAHLAALGLSPHSRRRPIRSSSPPKGRSGAASAPMACSATP